MNDKIVGIFTCINVQNRYPQFSENSQKRAVDYDTDFGRYRCQRSSWRLTLIGEHTLILVVFTLPITQYSEPRHSSFAILKCDNWIKLNYSHKIRSSSEANGQRCRVNWHIKSKQVESR